MSTLKSVRLSELLRRQILASVVAEYEKNSLNEVEELSLKDLQETISRTQQTISNQLWDGIYGHLTKHLDKIPEFMLGASRQLMVFMEDDTSFVFKGKTSGKRPCTSNSADSLMPKDEWEHVFKKLNTLKNVYDEVEVGARDLRNEIRPILDSVGSTKQLLEIWPSMENFLPPHIADPDSGVNLPALNISRLQEKIMGEKK